jgi:hypothetical protein
MPQPACNANVEDLHDVAAYDCLKLLGEVDSLHVKRIQLSGLLLFRYYRFEVIYPHYAPLPLTVR